MNAPEAHMGDGDGLPLIQLRYLTEQDHVWLAALLDEFERYVGRRRFELRERLKEPLATHAPIARLRLAAQVLDREYDDATRAPVSPVRIRRAVFGAAARTRDRHEALEAAGSELGIRPEEVSAALLADLPSERILAPMKMRMGAAELGLRTNHAMVASLLKKASHVRITAEGEVRAVVRVAKLRGLLCTAVPDERGRAVTLDISGPYALFRHTLVYGRALASLVSRAARCPRFELRAVCVLDGGRRRAELVVKSGDPIVPAAPLAPFDSKVEERFAREFAKAARDWDVIREPEAVPVGGGLVFPDFLLRHRRHPEQAYLVEIMGFWTREYVEKKLAALRAARLEGFILCIDESRNCAEADLPETAHVVRYRRFVAVADVIAILERWSAG